MVGKVIKQETIHKSGGLDQLKNHVGTVVKGDKVTLRYKGWYVDPKKGKLKEFEDMYHSEKKKHFVVGQASTVEESILDEAVRQLVLGENGKFTAAKGFGNVEHRGYVKRVPPNSDLVLDIAVLAVVRNGKTHNREVPKVPWWKSLGIYSNM